jgi:hypothetical protein
MLLVNPASGLATCAEKVSHYATKGGPARLGYYDNYLVDNASCVIVGVQAIELDIDRAIPAI